MGALTAIVTPLAQDMSVDWDGLDRLSDFQISQGISGIVPAGTTGESPTLNEDEHKRLISEALCKKVFVLAGCGSNCTDEATNYVKHAVRSGANAVLLVDPYYNGPSSLEIRKEYYEPIASAFPDTAIIPYIIPGRTGCALSVEDLAELSKEFPNICGVKEATGDLVERMPLTRFLTLPEFQIFSGDDDKTFKMMTTPGISACGVISVISNIAPAAVQEMCRAIILGDKTKAEMIEAKLSPLFKNVTVPAPRLIGKLAVIDKFRNPLAIKTMMNGLKMPAGPCRKPLGKMSQTGVQQVREALTKVWTQSPEILKPIEKFFSVDISQRLADDSVWAKLAY